MRGGGRCAILAVRWAGEPCTISSAGGEQAAGQEGALLMPAGCKALFDLVGTR